MHMIFFSFLINQHLKISFKRDTPLIEVCSCTQPTQMHHRSSHCKFQLSLDTDHLSRNQWTVGLFCNNLLVALLCSTPMRWFALMTQAVYCK